jgi:hypothetical protein
VRAWNGEYSVREENLKDLGYSPAQKEEMKSLCDRLTRLNSPELEDTAKTILANLGKINRPFLTELEDKLIQVLEYWCYVKFEELNF